MNNYIPTGSLLVSGKLMAGKTTLARDFIELGVSHAPLAAELKEDIARLCGITTEFIEQNKDLFRPILQYYGTDIMRKVYGDAYWVNRLKGRISSRLQSYTVTDDVRFPSEVFGFPEYNVFTVRLNISLEEQMRRFRSRFLKDPDPSIFFHESETALDDIEGEVWDVQVQVDGLTTLQVKDAVIASMKVRGFSSSFPIDNYSSLLYDAVN